MEKELLINNQSEKVNVEKTPEGTLSVSINGKSFTGTCIEKTAAHVLIEINGKRHKVLCSRPHFSIGERTVTLASPRDQKRKKGGASGNEEMSSPMPGKILKVLVKEGQEVEEGQGLVVMEAMKMEHTIKAAYPGKIAKIFYNEGDLVEGGVDLVEFIAQAAQGEEG